MNIKKIILISLGLIVLIWACKYINDKYLSSSFEPKGSMCPKKMERSRVLWLSHVQKSRENLVDYLDNLHSVDYNPLLQINNKMANFYVPAGDLSKENFANELNDYTRAISEPNISGGELFDTQDLKEKNMNLATILASSLSNVNKEKIYNMLQTHVNNVTEQINFHLAKDHRDEHQAYENTKKHIINLADYLVSGIPCQCKI